MAFLEPIDSYNQSKYNASASDAFPVKAGFWNSLVRYFQSFLTEEGVLSIKEINERTLDQGVTIEGVLFKDSNVNNLAVKTVKKTIGGVGVAGCDFNFATAANTTEQVIDLGAIVPARARVVDVYLVTEATFTGATTLVADVGNASGGAQFIASATIYAANAVLAAANAGAMLVAPNVAATKVYVNATPGANWSGVTAGKVTVYVTYIDVTNV